MSSGVINKITNIIMYVLFALLALGLVGGAYYLLTDYTTDSIYLVYGDTTVDSGGVSLDLAESGDGATFKIVSKDGWGAYSVTDCIVTVVPNVTENYDFEFTIDENDYGVFSTESDLTAAFIGENYSAYNGNGFAINADGEFTLTFIEYTADYTETAMREILSRVHGGKAIDYDGEIDILAYPYFALQIISPDGATSFKVPFAMYSNVYFITYELENVTAATGNATLVNVGEDVTLEFSAAANYKLPSTITITGATLESWDSSTGVAALSDVTGTVTVVIEGLQIYTITYNLTNCYADESNVTTLTSEDTVTLKIYADDGYTLRMMSNAYFEVTNATIVTWNSLSSVANWYDAELTISEASGDVVITIEGESGYYINGVWVFNDSVYGVFASASFYIDFTSNGESFNYIILAANGGLDNFQLCYGFYTMVHDMGESFIDEAYKTIDFGTTPQYVTAEFYRFLTYNATVYVEQEEGTYSVTVVSDCYQYIYSTSGLSSSVKADDEITVYITAKDAYIIINVGVSGATIVEKSFGTSSRGNTLILTLTDFTADCLIYIVVDDA